MNDASIPNVFMSECTQIPAILKADGTIQVYSSGEFLHLPDKVRDQIAQLVGGRVIWLKVEAQYLSLTTNHCTYKDCYSLAEPNMDRCTFHPQKSKGVLRSG